MKNTYFSGSRSTWAVVLIFLLAFSVRLYWIDEKETLYGDELTSLCLAYNQPGWGDQTFELNRVYTGEELRALSYVDQQGGLGGLAEDLAALHIDNRDLSHASLYYMLLRCALTPVQTPSMDMLKWYGCGLNLLIFAVSFILLWKLLRRFFPRDGLLVCLVLALAFLSRASVNNTIYVREYALAECLMTAWAYWSLLAVSRQREGIPLLTVRFTASGAVLAALLLSCGYFNALFVALTLLWLLVACVRRREWRNAAVCVVVPAAALLLCLAMYRGFFNFLTDVRTEEVVSNASADGFLTNLYAAVRMGIYIMGMYTLTPFVSLLLVAGIGVLAVRRQRWRMQERWLLACVLVWGVVIFFLAPWKEPRFVVPVFPLLMCYMGLLLFAIAQTGRTMRRITVVAMVCFAAFGWVEYNNLYLYRASERVSLEGVQRLIVYASPEAKYKYERNTPKLLIPDMNDRQEVVVVGSTDDIRRFSLPSDTVIYVISSRGHQELFDYPGLISIESNNEWDRLYKYKKTQP